MSKQQHPARGGVATTEYRFEGDHTWSDGAGISRALWPVIGLGLAAIALAPGVLPAQVGGSI